MLEGLLLSDILQNKCSICDPFSMNVERDIRFDLIARLCPNTTGAELRSVATEVRSYS